MRVTADIADFFFHSNIGFSETLRHITVSYIRWGGCNIRIGEHSTVCRRRFQSFIRVYYRNLNIIGNLDEIQSPFRRIFIDCGDSGDFLLVAITTGIILDLMFGSYYNY